MYNDELQMWENPDLRKLNEGKFCIRQCERIIVPTENGLANWYCPSCDRVLKILRKKKPNEKQE